MGDGLRFIAAALFFFLALIAWGWRYEYHVLQGVPHYHDAKVVRICRMTGSVEWYSPLTADDRWHD